ncbi:hypothetical protein FJZ31_42985 [Candidatus Poribacteria bacterium]|nr:hypothetical protein [Candidatus Poribacteria bacterium]
MKTIIGSCVAALMFLQISFAGTLTEDFNDGKMDGWTVLSGTWEVKNKELRQNQMGGPMVIVWDEPGELTDFTMTGKVMGLGGDADWGLALRVTDRNNHYSWQYVNSNLMFVTYINGTRTEAWKTPQAEILNEWQDFKVVAKGKTFELWWKGVKKNTFEHDALKKGKVGLFGWETAEAFDDITLTAEGVGKATVFPKDKLAQIWGQIKSY